MNEHLVCVRVTNNTHTCIVLPGTEANGVSLIFINDYPLAR